MSGSRVISSEEVQKDWAALVEADWGAWYARVLLIDSSVLVVERCGCKAQVLTKHELLTLLK